jgi:DNA-binding NarL/FixJ family response regulator
VTSVFIIAASDIARAGLESMIAREPGFSIAGSGADLSDLEAHRVDGASAGMVIFDADRLSEDAQSALRTMVEATYEGRESPGFVVIGAENEEWLTEALRAGVVRATLPRAASSAEIIAAVMAVSAGLIAIDADTFAAVIASNHSYEERSEPAGTTVEALTPREREVLKMLAEGLSNKEIAARMKISEHTVKFHTAQIFAKLGVSTRTEAVVQGIRQGLVMM